MHVVSQLPALGPLAGATLASNTAYLCLERFRYRGKIRAAAADQLSPLGNAAKLPTSITNHDQYKELRYLARLPNHDGLAKASGIKPAMPRGLWAGVYFLFFEYHEDLIFCGVLAAIATLILLSGVALSIDMWSSLLPYSYGAWAHLDFWVLTVGTALPAFFVLAGRWVSRKGAAHAIHNGAQLADLMKDMAEKAAAPPAATGAGGGRPPVQHRPRPQDGGTESDLSALSEFIKALGNHPKP